MKKILLLWACAVHSIPLCPMNCEKALTLSAHAVDTTERLLCAALGGTSLLSHTGTSYAQNAVDCLTISQRRPAIVSPGGKWILVAPLSKKYSDDQFLLCDVASKKRYPLALETLLPLSKKSNKNWQLTLQLVERTAQEEDELYSAAFLDDDTLIFSDTSRIYSVSCSVSAESGTLDTKTLYHDPNNGTARHERNAGSALYISPDQKIVYKHLKEGALSLIAQEDARWVSNRTVRFKRPVELHEFAGAKKSPYVAVHISTRAKDKRIAHGVALIHCSKKASKMLWPETGRWCSSFASSLAPRGNFLAVSDGSSLTIYAINLLESVQAIATISFGTMLNKIFPRWNSRGLFYNGEFLTTYKICARDSSFNYQDCIDALNNNEDTDGKKLAED